MDGMVFMVIGLFRAPLVLIIEVGSHLSHTFYLMIWFSLKSSHYNTVGALCKLPFLGVFEVKMGFLGMFEVKLKSLFREILLIFRYLSFSGFSRR